MRACVLTVLIKKTVYLCATSTRKCCCWVHFLFLPADDFLFVQTSIFW